ISYYDLIALLQTRFVNPSSDLIPKLERLGVPFNMLVKLKTNNDAATDALFDTLLPQGAAAPDPAEYGGDIKAWVKNDANYARIMGLITLAIPAWEASTQYWLGDCVQPTTPQAQSTLYYQCTQAGASGASEPNPWPTNLGTTCSDGSAVW